MTDDPPADEPAGRPSQQPSMVDILASIRRMVSQEADPQPGAKEGSAAPETAPAGQPGERRATGPRAPGSDPAIGTPEETGPDAAAASLRQRALERPIEDQAAGTHRAAAAGAPLTVEALVRDALQPILRQWLDEHLHRIVEETVARELRRLSRRD